MISTHALAFAVPMRPVYVAGVELPRPLAQFTKPRLWNSVEQGGTSSAALCLDDNEPCTRVLWHLRHGAEGAVGVCRTVNAPPGETVQVWLDGLQVEVPAGGKLDDLRPFLFERGLGACWTLRRPDMARAIAGALDALLLSPWSRLAYRQSFDRALNQLLNDN